MGILLPPAASHAAGQGAVTDRKRRRDRVLGIFRAVGIALPPLILIGDGRRAVKRAKSLKTPLKMPEKAK
jgi:hypothetical protein